MCVCSLIPRPSPSLACVAVGIRNTFRCSELPEVRLSNYFSESDRLQSGSILCFSSSFNFSVRIVHHFNTVNTLDMVESEYTRIQHVPLSIPRIRWSRGIRRLDTFPARKVICEKQGDVLEVFIPASACVTIIFEGKLHKEMLQSVSFHLL